jgi:hypothetical protein
MDDPYTLTIGLVSTVHTFSVGPLEPIVLSYFQGVVFFLSALGFSSFLSVELPSFPRKAVRTMTLTRINHPLSCWPSTFSQYGVHHT